VIRWTRVMGWSSLLCALLPCILFCELDADASGAFGAC
jgi:hypothetical protein